MRNSAFCRALFRLLFAVRCAILGLNNSSILWEVLRMAGKTDRFCLAGRRCACFVPADGVRGTAFLCGWNMEPMLPAIAEALPHTLLFFCGGGRRAGLHAVACAAGPAGRRVFGRRCGLPALSDGDGGAVVARAVQGAGGPGPARGARLVARRAVRALGAVRNGFLRLRGLRFRLALVPGLCAVPARPPAAAGAGGVSVAR